MLTFVCQFMQGVGQMRSYLIDNVRKNATKIFHGLGVEAECYSSSYDRSTTPVFVELLKSPKKPDETFATFPRVLFTNYEVVDRELFGSIAILNVCVPHLAEPLS